MIDLSNLFEELIKLCSEYNSNSKLMVGTDTDYNIKINYFNYTILFFKIESDINFKFCYELDDESTVFATLMSDSLCISRFVNQSHYTNMYSIHDQSLLFVYDHNTKIIYNKVGNNTLLNLIIENDIDTLYDINSEMELYFKLKGFW